MPASNIDLFNMQYARNNFGAMRPAPMCPEVNQLMGQCHSVHISTNCYYGYQYPKNSKNTVDLNDCEMMEVTDSTLNKASIFNTNTRKRRAEDVEYPKLKRAREEGTVPPTTNYNPCLLRPTHNNPDISRCLMVHMI